MDLFFSDLLLFWLIFSSDILKHLHWDFKKGNHFSFLLFFYHLLRYFFFLLIFCLMHIFLWYLHFFFQIYFSFGTRFVGFRFFSQIYSSFEWFLCSQIFFSMYIIRFIFSSQIYLSFSWCFALRALSNLTNTKKVTRILFFSFFYHLLRSTLFSIIFVFHGNFSLTSTYFCSVYFFRSTVGWVCSSHIYFSLGWCFSLRFLRTFTLLKKCNNFWFFFVLLPSTQI